MNVLLTSLLLLLWHARCQDIDKDDFLEDLEQPSTTLPLATIHIMNRKSRLSDLRTTLLSFPKEIAAPQYDVFVYLLQDNDDSDEKVSVPLIKTYEKLIKTTLPSARLVISPNMTDYSNDGAETLLFSNTLSVAPYLDLVTAFNVSEVTTKGRMALYLDGSTSPSPDFFSKMTAVIERSAASDENVLYGCTVLNSDQETIYRVGADFTSGKVGSTSWYSSSLPQEWPKNPPVPKYPFQGHSIRHPRVKEYTEPFVITHECFFASAKTLSLIGSFDVKLSEKLFMADYSLEARKKGIKIKRCTDCISYHQDERIPGYQELDLTKEAATPFYSKWLPNLTERITSRRKVHNMTLVWNMECGAGQTLGFTTEAINFVLALEDSISLKVEVGNKDQCRTELERSGWPRVVIDTVMRLSRVETEFKDNYTLVVHRDPGRYRSFITDRWGESTPTHVVGRSMYETSSIPSTWMSNCNDKVVQKIWVPSDFNVKTFAEAGINASLLTKLPEPLDTDLYSPYVFDKMKLPKNSGFVFLSISKFEKRKGFDKLVKAYIEEFGSDDKVSLYIRCNADDKNVKDFDELVKNCTEAKLNGPHASRGVPKNLPVLIRPLIPLTEMPSLYSAADCFVLPTHGEGWGLPIVEAMAMEVPVIATNWSGCTEYLRKDNAYLLEAEKLSDVEGNAGHKWAESSLDDLKALMRRAVDEKSGEAREKAKMARKNVVEGYSREAIVSKVIEKLYEVNQLPKYVEPRFFGSTNTGNTGSNTNSGTNYYNSYTNSRPTRIKINP